MTKLSMVLVITSLIGSTVLADSYRGDSHGDRRGGDRGHSYSGYSHHGYSDGGRSYGYYRNPRGEIVFGLVGLGLAAAIISSQRQVYVQPAPVVYVERQPQVVYVQQVQPMEAPQPPPRPLEVVINIQNSNGSMTPIMLRQLGDQWVGPRGEYYDAIPSVGQLRSVYGF